ERSAKEPSKLARSSATAGFQNPTFTAAQVNQRRVWAGNTKRSDLLTVCCRRGNRPDNELTFARICFKALLMNSVLNLTAQQLRRAARIKDKIQSLRNDLDKLFGPSPTNGNEATPPRKKRRMSVACRRRIAAAARRRWRLT